MPSYASDSLLPKPIWVLFTPANKLPLVGSLRIEAFVCVVFHVNSCFHNISMLGMCGELVHYYFTMNYWFRFCVSHILNRFWSIAVSFCLGMTSFSQPLLFLCQTTAALAASRFPKLLVLPLYELQPLITVFLNQLRLNPEKYLTA